MSRHNPFDRQRRTGDPGDTRQFLKTEGWELIDETDGRTRWIGEYEQDGTTMKGGLVEKASGERAYFVKDPTLRFWDNAHSGDCMLKPWNTVENAYSVHFEVEPDAWVDGIRRIEAMM